MRQTIAQFGFAQDAECGTPLGANHVAAALAARAINIGHDLALGQRVFGEDGGDAGFVIGMGEDGEDVGLKQRSAFFCGLRFIRRAGGERSEQAQEENYFNRSQPSGRRESWARVHE